MSMLPFTRPVLSSSMVPWELDQPTDPFAVAFRGDPMQQMMSDPLVRRTLQNVQHATDGMQPILRTDVLDMGDKYEVHADLPGIPKEELDITIGDGMITIKGERKKLFEEDDIWGNRRTERTFGKVSRSFTLPLDCDTDKAEALFEMGTLKVTFPKKAVSAASKKLLIT